MFGKVLLLEDDIGINKLLTDQLTKEGITVVRTFDGLEAIQAFDNSIDLAILDIMVPKLDGVEVLSRIRKISNIPVVFLTAKDSEVDKVLGLGLGADDYIIKPFSMIEVVYRIKAHLRRQLNYNQVHDNKKPILNYGDIEIDPNRMIVKVDNRVISFSVKEFELLYFFINSPGQVFTKQQLYEQIWQENYIGDDNTIMVHISRIRDKIQDNPKTPRYIKTIKGLGYRLELL